LEFNVPFQHKYGYIRDDTGSEQQKQNHGGNWRTQLKNSH